MMMISLRWGRRARHATLLLLLLLGVLAIGRGVMGSFPDAPASTTPTLSKRQSLDTEEERQSFLAGLGWAVMDSPCEVVEVVIPKHFDQIYQDYNQIQKNQGLNLEKYRGKCCTRYSYLVKNHPSDEPLVRVNLLVYKGKLVGGDVSAFGPGGFLEGLIPAAPLTPTDAETSSL